MRWREFGLLALVLANLLAIAGFLDAGIRKAGEQTGGWRRVDLDRVQELLRTGELNPREADWYRPLPKGEGR